MQTFLMAAGYLALTFLASILAFRLMPRSVAGRSINQHVWLFPLLPLLALMDALDAICRLVAAAYRWQVQVFDQLSGQPSRRSRKATDDYAYSFRYHARETERPARRKG